MKVFASVTTVTILALWLAAARPVNPVSLAISGLIAALLIALGLVAAGRFGKGALSTSGGAAIGRLAWSGLLGFVLGAIALAVLVYCLVPMEPALAERLRSRAGDPSWMPIVLAFESSVLEEVVFRLFLMSGLIWLLARGWRKATPSPSPIMVWTAIIISSLAFGLVHLPSWLQVAPPTPLLIGSVLALNGVAGIALGQVYWRWGLLAALVCHFAADVAVQGMGPKLIA